MSSPTVPLKKNLAAKQTATAVTATVTATATAATAATVTAAAAATAAAATVTATAVTAATVTAVTSTVTRIIQDKKYETENAPVSSKGLGRKGTAERAIPEKILDLYSSSSVSSSSCQRCLPTEITIEPDPIVRDSTLISTKGVTRFKVPSSNLAVPPVAAFGRVGRGKNKKYRNSIEPIGIRGADVGTISDRIESKICNEISSSKQESDSCGEDIVENLPKTFSTLLPSPAVLSYAAAASHTIHCVKKNSLIIDTANITATTQGMDTATEERGKQVSGPNILSKVRAKNVRNTAHASSNLLPDSTSTSACIVPKVDTSTSTIGIHTYYTDGFIYSEEQNTMFGQERGDGGLVKG